MLWQNCIGILFLHKLEGVVFKNLIAFFVALIIVTALINFIVTDELVYILVHRTVLFGNICLFLRANEFTGTNGPNSELTCLVESSEEASLFSPNDVFALISHPNEINSISVRERHHGNLIEGGLIR